MAKSGFDPFARACAMCQRTLEFLEPASELMRDQLKMLDGVIADFRADLSARAAARGKRADLASALAHLEQFRDRNRTALNELNHGFAGRFIALLEQYNADMAQQSESDGPKGHIIFTYLSDARQLSAFISELRRAEQKQEGQPQ